jgi:hypothetical protein
MARRRHTGQRTLGATRVVGPRRDESRFKNSTRRARAVPLSAPDHGGRGLRWRSGARIVVLWHDTSPRRFGPNAGKPWGACTIINEDGGVWGAYVLDGPLAPHFTDEWAFAIRRPSGWWYWPDRMMRATRDPEPDRFGHPGVEAWEAAFLSLRPQARPIPMQRQIKLPR